MPARRKGANLGRRTNTTTYKRNRRAQRTDEQIQQDNANARVSMAQLRESQSQEGRAERNQQRRLEQRQARRFVANDRQRHQVHRVFTSDSFLRLAFENEEHYMEDSVAKKLNIERAENQTFWTSNLEDSIDIKEEPVEFKEEPLDCYEQVRIEIFHNDNEGEEIHPEIGFSTEDIEASKTILDTYRNSLKDNSLFQHIDEQYIRSKSFSKPSHLVGTHSRDKPHKCEICKKRFVRKSVLTIHLRLHSGVKPYRCDICNKSFSQRPNLTTHLRMHSGEKPYRCDICNKSFSHRSNLTTHSRLHSADKPYHCDMCGKSFSEHAALMEHSRIHSRLKPHHCKFCEKTFAYRSELDRHLRTHSKLQP